MARLLGKETGPVAFVMSVPELPPKHNWRQTCSWLGVFVAKQVGIKSFTFLPFYPSQVSLHPL